MAVKRNHVVTMASALLIVLTSPVAMAAHAMKKPSSSAGMCQAINDVVEENLKTIALEDISDIGDDSAPRATLRQLRINNAWLSIRMNYELGRQYKCAPRRSVFATTRYIADAMGCATARLRGNYRAPECDQSKWGEPKTDTPATAPAAGANEKGAPEATSKKRCDDASKQRMRNAGYSDSMIGVICPEASQ